MKQKGPASSSDEIAVFQAYVDLINSERETLWARHNALLVANSLIIGALAMIGAGLVVSATWAGLSILAWSSIKRHAELAGTFASTCFAQLPNPFTEAISTHAQKRMHQLVLLLIAVFMFMYLGLALIRLT